jgi:tight adherence protein C
MAVLLFSVAIFLSIVAASFVLMTAFVSRAQVRQRVGSSIRGGSFANASGPTPLGELASVNERLLSASPARLTQLRLDMQRAGFFSDDAPRIFLLLRTISILALPTLGFLAATAFMPSSTLMQRLLLTGVMLIFSFLLPNAALDRLKLIRTEDYRRKFPDLLDMLTVCVDAGLSFEGALQRLANDFSIRSPLMGINLQILSSELRAGRPLSEALDALADRLGLDEAKSFATLLKQSLELGSDIGSALRVYSEEMREKRVMRAEEKANRLPVVMVIPLGLFIFPVIMLIILFPAAIKITENLKNFGGG